MKVFNLVYNDCYQLCKYINANKIYEYDNVLVQTFVGKVDHQFIIGLIKELLHILPQAHIIGLTTGGEILNQEVSSGTTILSICVFEKTTIKSGIFYSDNDDLLLGQSMAKQLATDNTKIMIVYGTVTSVSDSAIMAGVESINNKFMVAGSNTWCARDGGETLVFSNEGITEKGAVAVTLNSDVLRVCNEYSTAWQSIGKVMTITKCYKNRLYEIDGTPISELYKKYFGEQVPEKFFDSTYEFKLIKLDGGIEYTMSIIKAYDDGSVEVVGNITEGTRVTFGYVNFDILLDRYICLLNKIIQQDWQAIFVYSCSNTERDWQTRFHVWMQDIMQSKLEYLPPKSPICGFFGRGKYYQTAKGKNIRLTAVTNIVGLSENVVKAVCKDFKKETKDKGNVIKIIEILNNFIKVITQDLEEKNRIEAYARALKENQEVMIALEKTATLGHLIAGIAHNFKRPLMSSVSGLSMLSEHIEKIQAVAGSQDKITDITLDMEKWLQHLRDSLDYIFEIVNTVSKHVAVSDPSIAEEFTVGKLINQMGILTAFELKKYKCRLRIDVQVPEDFKLKGNISDLLQVLKVLISNAIDSYNGLPKGNKHGVIEFQAENEKGNLNITVSDYGKGIPEHIGRKIFKEMVTDKGRYGTGIGLYIAIAVIKGRFRGSMNFCSTVGKGSTFTICIPTETLHNLEEQDDCISI